MGRFQGHFIKPFRFSSSESSKAEANSSETRNLNIEKLPKLIPRSSWLNSSGANGTSTTLSNSSSRETHPPPLQNSQKVATRQNSVICVSAPRSLAPVTSTANPSNGASNSSQQSKAKISLVPTNLLLNQQKAQNVAGKNFFVSKSMGPMTPTTITQSVVDANKSKMPMKVLLVNTMHNTTHMASSVTTPAQVNTKAEIIPVPLEVKTSAPTTTHRAAKRPIRRTPLKRRRVAAIPGMRSLLSSLIRTQQEANFLNRQRLQLDTEKFHNEKRVVDDILGLVPILKDIGTQFLKSQTAAPESGTPSEPPPTSKAPQCNGHYTKTPEDDRPVEEQEVDEDEEEDVSVVEPVVISDT